MDPIRYVDFLNGKYQSLGFPAYQWTVNDLAPSTPLRKPLGRCCVSLLTTCGASTLDRPPFDADARNDLRVDAIAADTPDDHFQVHDNYYDHTDDTTGALRSDRGFTRRVPSSNAPISCRNDDPYDDQSSGTCHRTAAIAACRRNR